MKVPNKITLFALGTSCILLISASLLHLPSDTKSTYGAFVKIVDLAAATVRIDSFKHKYASSLLARGLGIYEVVTAKTVEHVEHCCEEGMVWLLLGGHLRTFEKNLLNVEKFIQPAGCFFIVIYTRQELESTTKAWWKNASEADVAENNSTTVLDRLFSFHPWLSQTPFAYAVVSHDTEAGQNDVFDGLWLLQKYAQSHLGIQPMDSDVFIRSRPDLLYSHTLDYSRLRNLAYRKINLDITEESQLIGKPGYAFLVRHESKHFVVFDPSELFWIGNLGYFESLYAPVKAQPTNFTSFYDGPNHGCCTKQTRDCEKTTFFSRLVFRPNRLGQNIYFIRGDIKIHIHRLSGDRGTSINRPGNSVLTSPARDSLEILDVTREALQVLNGLESHCVDPQDLISPENVIVVDHALAGDSEWQQKCYARGQLDGVCRDAVGEWRVSIRHIQDTFLPGT